MSKGEVMKLIKKIGIILEYVCLFLLFHALLKTRLFLWKKRLKMQIKFSMEKTGLKKVLKMLMQLSAQ